MKIVHEIALDVSRHGVQATIPLTQHDAGVHRLVFDLYNGSVPIILGARDQVALYIDGDIYEACTVYTENGVYPNCVVCDLSAVVTQEVGEKGAVLQIYRDADSLVYSPEIGFIIRADRTNGSQVLNSPQYSAVVKAQLAAEQYALEAQKYAQEAGNAVMQVRIDPDSFNWEVSYDNGLTWADTGMSASGIHIGSDIPSRGGVNVWLNPWGEPDGQSVVLRVKDINGNWIPIPAIRGEKGADGDVAFNDLTDAQKESLKGKSAYQIAVDEGFDGTEEEWVASLKGADGKDGAAAVLQTTGSRTDATISQAALTKLFDNVDTKIEEATKKYYLRIAQRTVDECYLSLQVNGVYVGTALTIELVKGEVNSIYEGDGTNITISKTGFGTDGEEVELYGTYYTDPVDHDYYLWVDGYLD